MKIFKNSRILEGNNNHVYHATVCSYDLTDDEVRSKKNSYRMFHGDMEYVEGERITEIVVSNAKLPALLASLIHVQFHDHRINSRIAECLYQDDVENWLKLYMREGHSMEDFNKNIINRYTIFDNYEDFHDCCCQEHIDVLFEE